jgi:ferredoxin-nitrite reductase
MGDGDIRLTVWQNLLISGIPDERVGEAEAAIEALGLSTKATSIRAGLVACTGNTGCRFAASDTKLHAEDIARRCESLELDTPVNIHVTGCHHSCAQHHISEIGCLAAKVEQENDGEQIEAYHIYVGGGFGPDARIGGELWRDVPADEAPERIERLLKAYLANRASPGETFLAFAQRHDTDALRTIAETEMETVS